MQNHDHSDRCTYCILNGDQAKMNHVTQLGGRQSRRQHQLRMAPPDSQHDVDHRLWDHQGPLVYHGHVVILETLKPDWWDLAAVRSWFSTNNDATTSINTEHVLDDRKLIGVFISEISW